MQPENIFPKIEPNKDGNITDIADTILNEIKNRLESLFEGSFSPEEVPILRGLIYLAYNKSHSEGRQPEIKDLVKAIERTENTLIDEAQIRKFKELKEKLERATR